MGEVPNADAFLALVAEEPKEGGSTREVRAYLCDGRNVNEWFKGSVDGNGLGLSSDNGASLKGQLARDGASGTIALADGTSYAFNATPVTGIAGLYDVVQSAEGRVSGTSEGGGRLEGQIAEEPRRDGRYLVGGTITAPDGQSRDFGSISTSREASEMRLIVLSDARVKGGSKIGTGKAVMQDFIDPTNDL